MTTNTQTTKTSPTPGGQLIEVMVPFSEMTVRRGCIPVPDGAPCLSGFSAGSVAVSAGAAAAVADETRAGRFSPSRTLTRAESIESSRNRIAGSSRKESSLPRWKHAQTSMLDSARNAGFDV